MEAEKGNRMTDTEKRGRGCMILALVGLVGHLVALRVIAGIAEPWGNLPWGLQAILLLCCLLRVCVRRGK